MEYLVKYSYIIFLFLYANCVYAQFTWEQHTHTVLPEYKSEYVTGSMLEVINGVVECRGKLIGYGSRNRLVGLPSKQVSQQFFVISTDSGKTFQLSNYPNIEEDLVIEHKEVAQCNDSTYFTTGFPRIYRTTNYGESWDSIQQNIPTPKGSFPRFWHCSFKNNVGVIADVAALRIYVTTNTGDTWRTVRYDSLYASGDLFDNVVRCFSDSVFYLTQYNFFKGNNLATRFYMSRDQGASWQTLGCTINGYTGDSSNNVFIRDFKIISNTVAYGYGAVNSGGYFSNAIFKTTNTGLTWSVVDTIPLFNSKNGYYSFLYNFGEDTVIVVTGSGVVRATLNGGISWIYYNFNPITLQNNVTAKINTCWFWNSQEAIAIAPKFDIPLADCFRLTKDYGTVVHDRTAEDSHLFQYRATPNPASSVINVECLFEFDQNELSARLVNYLGSTVSTVLLSKKITNDFFEYSQQLNVREIPSGVYYVVLQGTPTKYIVVPISIVH